MDFSTLASTDFFQDSVNLLDGQIVFFCQVGVIGSVELSPNLQITLGELSALIFRDVNELTTPVVGDEFGLGYTCFASASDDLVETQELARGLVSKDVT